MMLDRGEQLGWFESPEIWIEMILAIIGFYFFLADCLTSARPFISVRIFKDWDFWIALVFMFLVGVMLLASLALVTPFIQNLLGYPVLSSGFLLGTRGIGTFVGMFLVGRLSGRVDPRLMIFIGLVLAAGSLWLMVGWSLDVPANTIVINSIAQGLGLGFIFLPLDTIAFASLPGELRTEGAWALDAHSQHRLRGRHLGRHRASNQHDHHVPQPAGRARDAVQRRAENAERFDGLGTWASEHGDA